MVLVDTSAWIASFRRKSPISIESYAPLDEIATCLPIVQEVLQGIDDEAAFSRMKVALLSLEFLEPSMDQGLFEEAVALYRAARRVGLTIRSSVDCLIAACALRHQATILHDDRDFAGLARVSALKHRRV